MKTLEDIMQELCEEAGIEESRKMSLAISNFNEIQSLLLNMKDFRAILKKVERGLERLEGEPNPRVSNALMAASSYADVADDNLKKAWKQLAYLASELK